MGSNEINLSIKIKLIIITIIFAIAFIALCIVYSINNKSTTNNTKNDKSKTNIYVDPGSGETVIEPTGKASEKTDSVNSIAYLGFTSLLDHGMTNKQFLNLKSHFKQYAVVKKINIKEVSITLSTYKSIFDQKTGERITTLEVTVNRKNKYDAKITYKGLDMPILYLYKKNSSTLIFKSYIGGN